MADNLTFKQVNINVNDRCNAHCVYCDFPNRGTNAMSTSMIQEVIGFLNHFKIPSVHFFGKEPTLDWSIIKEIVEGLAYRAAFGITTNGHLMSQYPLEEFQWMKEHDFVVLISFDGLLQMEQRAIPQDEIQLLVQKCRASGLHTTALCCVTPAQVKHLYSSAQLIYSMGFHQLAFNKVVTGLDKYDFDWNLLRSEYRKVLDEFGNYPDFRIVQFARRMRVWNDTDSRYFKLAKRRSTCGACFGGIAIDWDGTIYPCQHPNPHTGMELGHVLTGISINKIEQIRALDFIECKGCSLYPCSGCYLDNFMTHGNILKLNKLGCRFEATIREIELQYCYDNKIEVPFLAVYS